MDVEFEWDEAKNQSNQRKHRVSFELAEQVFFDPYQVVEHDSVVDGEERLRIYGLVDGLLLLLVIHTMRSESDAHQMVRIISARRVSRRERRVYERADR